MYLTPSPIEAHILWYYYRTRNISCRVVSSSFATQLKTRFIVFVGDIGYTAENSSLRVAKCADWIWFDEFDWRLSVEMADRLRLVEQQRRDKEARRQTEGDESQRVEEERRQQEELENERIYHEELQR